MTEELAGQSDESLSEAATGTSNLTAILLVITWAWVGVPLLYGLYELVLKARPLFTK